MPAKWVVILSQLRPEFNNNNKPSSTELIISSDFFPYYEMHMLIINMTYEDSFYGNTRGKLVWCT